MRTDFQLIKSRFGLHAAVPRQDLQEQRRQQDARDLDQSSNLVQQDNMGGKLFQQLRCEANLFYSWWADKSHCGRIPVAHKGSESTSPRWLLSERQQRHKPKFSNTSCSPLKRQPQSSAGQARHCFSQLCRLLAGKIFRRIFFEQIARLQSVKVKGEVKRETRTIG